MPTIPTEFIHSRAQSRRRKIVKARVRLADDDLTRTQRTELWHIVDYHEW